MRYKMNRKLKIFAGVAALVFMGAQLFADPPAKRAVPANANISVVEALQNSFRSISQALLPAVVEVDVTETKTYTTNYKGIM